jgi:uncharacterized HAD superfamily protein
MKVGVDLDDVVVNFVPPLLEFYNAKFNENHFLTNGCSYYLWDIVGKSREEITKVIWDFIETESFENIDFIPGAKEAVKDIAKNHELFFITSRSGRIKKKTPFFLKKHFSDINFNLVFTGDFHGSGKTKADFCKEFGIEFYVEDHKKFAQECAENGTKVLLLDKPWNQGELYRNITRVKGWDEILEVINGKNGF